MWLIPNIIAETTKSLEEMAEKYENDKNSVIANSEKENIDTYEDFYDELEIQMEPEVSMNIIFFGPPDSFMRLDAETILHILSNTKKQLIPIKKVLQAWDIITAFGSLLNVVPEEDLYYTNMGDPSVLKYFANFKIGLHRRKIGVLISAYRRYYGNSWYMNGSNVNGLGYLLCGFPPCDLQKITPTIMKELNSDVLGKLHQCNEAQVKTLYDIAVHPDAYGIPERDIGSLQLEAIPAITVNVMKTISQKKLTFFTKQQIMRMELMTQRLYVLRMQLRFSIDLSELSKRGTATKNPSIALIISYSYLVLSQLHN
ncbi:hypothetical protein MSG28_004300 [Choristoneura fumiferana]|uniref:Uncharacterized protein n=1 Tax=Choristoneura fumiferana TaxID=7141 RepID=A0ACC0KIW5_CHOFU|nr:hypothetical protein MSG28_004300 [Choristoneura fumiferana]